MKRIAVIGAGISGLTAAWYLSRDYRVVVYEAEDYIGGHTHTVPVSRDHGDYRIDTGFIVFNDRTYPNFLRLLEELGVGRQPTNMGFSVTCGGRDLEYCGDGLGGFFAQRSHLLSFRHWRLLREILRFNREARDRIEQAGDQPTLGEFLQREGYSEHFQRHYILAMGSAIWSCGESHIREFPADFFIRFFDHHGLLALRNRPQWYVVPGGSASYVRALLSKLDAEVRCGAPVASVRRDETGVRVATEAGGEEYYDEVVFACHSDQTMALLQDADAREATLLSGIPWQDNEVVLHTDERMLPRRRRAWSSWNALLPREKSERVAVTYNMNMLQGIDAPETFCVSLNCSDLIDPRAVIGRYRFFHPLFTHAGLAFREQIRESNGKRHTWFCGAWCGNGFHEDGVVSALEVARALGVTT